MDARYFPILRNRSFTPPAAGQPFTFTPDTSAGFLIQTVRLQFTTDANVATRELNVNVSDGTTEWFRTGCATGMDATQTRDYSAFDGSVSGVATLPVRIFDWPNNGLFVPQGNTLTITWENIQAGDVFESIGMCVVEFPTGPRFKMWPLTHFFTEESE